MYNNKRNKVGISQRVQINISMIVRYKVTTLDKLHCMFLIYTFYLLIILPTVIFDIYKVINFYTILILYQTYTVLFKNYYIIK